MPHPTLVVIHERIVPDPVHDAPEPIGSYGAIDTTTFTFVWSAVGLVVLGVIGVVALVLRLVWTSRYLSDSLDDEDERARMKRH